MAIKDDYEQDDNFMTEEDLPPVERSRRIGSLQRHLVRWGAWYLWWSSGH